MNIDNSPLLQQAFTTTFPSDKPREDCPSAEEIWDGARDKLPPAQLRNLVQHLAACPLCTEAWLMAEEMEGPPMGKDLAPVAPPRRIWRQAFAVAATLIFALTAGILLRSNDQPGPPAAMRQAEAPKIELLSPTVLSSRDDLLRWQGPADTRYYKLRVIMADNPLGEPLVVEPELKASQYRITPELLEPLPTGSRLQIYIEAVSPLDGRDLTEVFYIEVP